MSQLPSCHEEPVTLRFAFSVYRMPHYSAGINGLPHGAEEARAAVDIVRAMLTAPGSVARAKLVIVRHPGGDHGRFFGGSQPEGFKLGKPCFLRFRLTRGLTDMYAAELLPQTHTLPLEGCRVHKISRARLLPRDCREFSDISALLQLSESLHSFFYAIKQLVVFLDLLNIADREPL